MSRSIRIRQEVKEQVKLALRKQGYPRQKDLAEDLVISMTTVNNFFNAKPIDCINFQEICRALDLDWRDIADLEPSPIVPKDSPPIEVVEEGEGYNYVERPLIYVERPPIESLCYQTLCQPGTLLRIKAPGWMGKTLLMATILPQLEREGYRQVLLNLRSAEFNDLNNLERFLQWLCLSVGKSLRMPNRLADYWNDEYSTSKINCTTYFEEYLLPQADSPLILCLDEVDQIFSYEAVAADFLGLLRVWHEKAKFMPIWRKLRLVVVHSTEVYVPLQVNESPFNVGVPIELPEFTPEQVQNLAQQYGLTFGLDEVEQLMAIVGGLPHLVGETFNHLKMNSKEGEVIGKRVNLSQILPTAATDAGIYSHYLRHYWSIVQKNPELTAALKQVVAATGNIAIDRIQAYNLHRMGLVKLLGNEVTIACNLYRQYFSDCFGLGETI